MNHQQFLEKLQQTFSDIEKTASAFTSENFFRIPASGKWSAAENIQHLFLSAKPLVGLFGKPDLMLQWGKANRPLMSYDELVNAYHEKLGTPGIVLPNPIRQEVAATQTEQVGNLHSIHAKFLERTASLPEVVLNEYHVPHPLLGLLTVREFLYFTDYHTLHHHNTILAMKQE